MALDRSNSYDDMEQVRRRFEEFRQANPVRARFPEALWVAAAELATRHGVKASASALRLAVPGPDFPYWRKRNHSSTRIHARKVDRLHSLDACGMIPIRHLWEENRPAICCRAPSTCSS